MDFGRGAADAVGELGHVGHEVTCAVSTCLDGPAVVD